MLPLFSTYFTIYPQAKAPFMHKQLAEWKKARPLAGLKVLHHVPVVPNTLLKISCLVAAGAEVTVTNPSFLTACPDTIAAIKKEKINYVENLADLKNQDFDIYFDCGAELYQALGAPKLGAVELTATGDHFYRAAKLNFPVMSIDPTLTKQLETVFGSAESAHQAIAQLTHVNVKEKTWLIFGFGKIGRGLTYFCVENNIRVFVVDVCSQARGAAQSLGVTAINPDDKPSLQNALSNSDIIVTATGKSNILDVHPKHWFENKVLANMGVLDEFGQQFSEHEVLNNKRPINFVLNDPTPMQYIDPEFYAHNIAALDLLNDLPSGVTNLRKEMDEEIIDSWCQYHSASKHEMTKWFFGEIYAINGN